MDQQRVQRVQEAVAPTVPEGEKHVSNSNISNKVIIDNNNQKSTILDLHVEFFSFLFEHSFVESLRYECLKWSV